MSWWSDEAIGALASLPGFLPASERAARDLLSRTLESILLSGSSEILDREAHARDLANEVVARMIEYDKWPGPAHFFQIARRVRFGEPGDYASASVPHLSQYLPTPETATGCPQCADFGYRVRKSSYQRCECPAGRALGERFLDLLNGRSAKPGKLERPTRALIERVAPRAITQADIDEALHARRVREALVLDATERLGGTHA